MHKGRLYVVLQYKREQISSYIVLSQEEHIQSFLKKSDYWPWRKHSHCIWTQQKMQDSQDLKKQYLYIYIYISFCLYEYLLQEGSIVCVCGIRIISERKLLHIGFHQRTIKITFLANDSTALLS